jgi:hypothetical protein
VIRKQCKKGKAKGNEKASGRNRKGKERITMDRTSVIIDFESERSNTDSSSPCCA